MIEETGHSEEITIYLPTVGTTAVNSEESGAEKVYDFFQSIGGKSFLFMGDHGFLEHVPVKEAGNFLTRYARQLILLFKHAMMDPERPLDKKVPFTSKAPIETEGKPSDFFCQERAKDQVLWEGKTVKILYPDNPITERHFLFVTKTHRDSFKDITKEEFVEVLDLAKRVGNLFPGDKYVLCKTGLDAGQTVPHFHLHLIIADGKVEGICGRLKIARNILLNSTPFLNGRIKGKTLEQRVAHYRRELACLSF